ncbi:MAG: hypothetical protein HYV09_27550 [Deltaproteobacteria bacterium]|nr:hypothetical protein [Deltaproteobacteria bacterium]
MNRLLGSALVLAALGCGGKTVYGGPADGGGDEGVLPDDGVIDPDTGPIIPPPPPKASDKVDLLFVIDNSISMADKQLELARRIPEMVRDLVEPLRDPSGKPLTKPVFDLHIGVITSSLGSHGTSACAPEVTNRRNDDRGHLLPRAGEGGGTGWKVDGTGTVTSAPCPTPVVASPVRWAFDASKGTADYYGSAGAQQAELATTCVVQAAKDDGCGYEETLESMYHFLIDPAPYDSAKVKCTFGISGDACGNNKILVEGLDEELLAQRKAFLRPDSSVVIVVLSDENDASLKPAGLNWLPWGYGKGQMMRGWSSCDGVPDEFEPESPADFSRLHNDLKCFSCFEDAKDPNCAVKWPTDPLNNDIDNRNLRAFRQVQRFGYNFLWGRQRYVDGLTKASVLGSDGRFAPNPLFASGRSPGNVLFAAIVGVPKELVNGPDGVAKPLGAGDWEKIVGPVGLRDPHMIESIAPRPGVPKYAGDPSIDPINGGDRDIFDGGDLQYACIAPRSSTAPSGSYDCEGSSAKSNPLCSSTGVQVRFKAYPGLRHLRVAREVNGFVGSICDPGLTGAVRGLVRRIQPLIR